MAEGVLTGHLYEFSKVVYIDKKFSKITIIFETIIYRLILISFGLRDIFLYTTWKMPGNSFNHQNKIIPEP